MTVFSASEEKPIEEQILHGKLYFTMPDTLRSDGPGGDGRLRVRQENAVFNPERRVA